MLSSTHIKAKIKSENASFRADEIVSSLLQSSPEVISFLTEKVDWFEALRILQRRFEQSTYNQDGTPWVFALRDSSKHRTIERLNVLFPDVIEICCPTQKEIEDELAEN